MAILWAGGEDIDFLAGTAPTVVTTAGHFRTYARCSVYPSPVVSEMKSNPLSTPVSAVWVAFQAYFASGITFGGNRRCVTIMRSTTGQGLGLGISNVGAFATICKWDGTTLTHLATSAYLLSASSLARLDIQILGFGTNSTTVNLFVNGTALIATWTGDTSSWASLGGVDQIGSYNGGNSAWAELSEVIIADEDTRGFTLQTMALTGAGTTDAWTAGVFSNINGTSYSDTTPANTNTAGQNEQFNVTDMPSGTWNVRAVKIAARAAYGAGGTPTKITLGYNNGGAVGAATPGATKTLSAGYTTYDELDNTDPTNAGAAWTQAEMNALQLNVASAT